MVILSAIGVVGVFRVSVPVIVVVFVVWWWMINVHSRFHFVDRCSVLCAFCVVFSVSIPLVIRLRSSLVILRVIAFLWISLIDFLPLGSFEFVSLGV